MSHNEIEDNRYATRFQAIKSISPDKFIVIKKLIIIA